MIGRLIATTLLAALAAVNSARAIEDLESIHLQWTWSMLGEAGLNGNLEVGDLDSDGGLEIVSLSSSGQWTSIHRWQVHDFDGELRQEWSSLPLEGEPRFLRLISRPSGQEVLILRDSIAEVFAGATKEPIRAFPLPEGYLTAARVGDIDQDGDPDLAICNGLDFFVVDPIEGKLVATRPGFGCSDLDFGQADQDPALEIVLGGNGFGGLILDGETLELEWALLSGLGEIVRLVDVTGDGFDDVVAVTDYPEALRAIEVPTGAELWEVPARFTNVLLPADLDGDGREELVLSGALDTGILVLDSASGDLLWSATSLTGAAGAAVVADLDGDGATEIAWTTEYAENPAGGSLSVVDAATGSLSYVSPDLEVPLLGLAVGDFDLDGASEVVGSASNGWFEDAGAGRRLDWSAPSGTLERVGPPISGGAWGARLGPLVAPQLDGDPVAEVCFIVAGGAGDRVRCEDGATGSMQWETPILPEFQGSAILAAQLDEDPIDEIVVATLNGSLFAFEGESGWLKWASEPLQSEASFRDVQFGDVVGDAGAELIAGGLGATGSDVPLVVYDAATGLLALPEPTEAVDFAGFDLAQLDTDEQLEVVVARTNGEVAVFDPVLRSFEPPIAMIDGIVLRHRIADVTRDGVVDVIAAVFAQGLVVWNGGAGAVTWSSPWLGDYPALDNTLWIANLDDDPLVEIAVGFQAGIAVFEAPLVLLLRAGFETGDTSEWSSTQP